MSIQLFITGGTIAKTYNPITGELSFDPDHLNKMLAYARSTADIAIETLMLKDSLDMDDVDREILLQSCQSTKGSKIIVLHGTDTMIESAKKLSAIEDKTIILTGAMVPFACKESDALFNLGTAFGAISTLESGVYLAMNGQIFMHNSVEKDKDKGEFASLTAVN